MASIPNVPGPHQWSERASPASWLLFVVIFAVFLAVALSASLLALRWRSWLPGAEGEGSLISGVRSAVYTALSHLI
jgi:light-harvesting complex 1 beta chain